MLLVKKRAHLGAYEKALREMGVPFVSDKRGGLLESLEVSDLIALLTFLITPGDDLALAQVLKSPIGGAGDEDLIALARGVGSWWRRLRMLQQRMKAFRRRRCARRTACWNPGCAPRRSCRCTDLADLILHQGELLARYAAGRCNRAAQPGASAISTPSSSCRCALDAGRFRYPSLPKFIDGAACGFAVQRRCQRCARRSQRAGRCGHRCAVRILTIHSAKGLEAAEIALLDANYSEAARDDLGILCDWPLDPRTGRRAHFSAFGRKSERGSARDALFAEEDRLKQQEDFEFACT